MKALSRFFLLLSIFLISYGLRAQQRDSVIDIGIEILDPFFKIIQNQGINAELNVKYWRYSEFGASAAIGYSRRNFDTVFVNLYDASVKGAYLKAGLFLGYMEDLGIGGITIAINGFLSLYNQSGKVIIKDNYWGDYQETISKRNQFKYGFEVETAIIFRIYKDLYINPKFILLFLNENQILDTKYVPGFGTIPSSSGRAFGNKLATVQIRTSLIYKFSWRKTSKPN
ncbi:hypothetical protein JYT51_00550 [Candidatus Amoebophilus asiaticus]|nr:hypothetical protein [Candidatus Amoebophilus asiaticus]